MTIRTRRLLFHLAVGLVTVAAVLAGCAAPIERVVPAGEPGHVPYGWVDWCARNPADPSCPGAAP